MTAPISKLCKIIIDLQQVITAALWHRGHHLIPGLPEVIRHRDEMKSALFEIFDDPRQRFHRGLPPVPAGIVEQDDVPAQTLPGHFILPADGSRKDAVRRYA